MFRFADLDGLSLGQVVQLVSVLLVVFAGVLQLPKLARAIRVFVAGRQIARMR